MSEPQFGRRLNNTNELLLSVSKCSHLAVWRSSFSYYHHFMVTDVTPCSVTIIEYGCNRILTKVQEKLIDLGEATCSNLLDFQSGLYLIEDPSYPSNNAQKDKAIQRAKKRLGQEKYQASTGNCEHFVTYALTGISRSYQFERCGIGKRALSYFIDYLVEWKSCLFKTSVRQITTKIAEVINNHTFYMDLAMRVTDECPGFIKCTLRCVGLTSESIESIIAMVASYETVINFLGYGSRIVEVGTLLIDLKMYISDYRNEEIDLENLLKQMIKRIANATTALALDWRLIPGFISSITPLHTIAVYAVLVVLAQCYVSVIAPVLCDVGCKAEQWFHANLGTHAPNQLQNARLAMA